MRPQAAPFRRRLFLWECPLPFTNAGVFNPKITFVDGTPATAEDQNTQDGDIAGGLTQCMTRGGLAPATANIPMGGFKFTNLGPGSAATDSVNYGQIAGPGSSNPTGEIIIFAGLTVPAGFLFCNGAAVSRIAYPNLFAAIGTTYGSGDGGTTFNVPDMRGNVAAGADNIGGTPANRLPGYNVGTAGGSAAITLIANQLPVAAYTDTGHDHAITDPDHSHAATSPGQFVETGGGSAGELSAGTGLNVQSSTQPATTGITINTATANITNAGGGQGHSNVQPTLAFNYLIRY